MSTRPSTRLRGEPIDTHLVDALKGRTIVDASCDAQGNDDGRLRLDDGTTILVDVELDVDFQPLALALGRRPWPRLAIRIGGDELWPDNPA